jgi:hypothetical protein
MQAVAAHAPAGVTTIPIAASLAHMPLRLADVQALAQAIGALAELAMRETRQTAATVASYRNDDGTVRVLIAVAPDTAAIEGGGASPATTEPVPFNRGGLGLSLCLASYILASHGATATATPDLAHIDVRLADGSEQA